MAMTAVSTMAGLVLIMLSTGTGSDVTHRIAAPMLGGMLTVSVLNLIVLSVLQFCIVVSGMAEKVSPSITERKTMMR